ncbi:MAG: tyrosine protein phosphatase [Rhizobiales bacterium 17-65-6]|nr:MAG: tyrosine protein phosphatase [Rhizobiales bacterium 12-68-15]OYX87467.1 MAG: tyrosine protein phosphatase [Azorhizobium sp. 35-67-5]OYX88991.1 MAG: tyrosine protein phosphatase [Azorhizobium sp. 32-67-21]OYZ99258.1 MAG: tyrosine protein phosphatase [Rhizobiales bacterium 17-65-6]
MIHVCSLSRLHETVERTGARHVITLINGGTVLTRPSNVDPTNHLFLGLNDIVEEIEGLVAPGETHMHEMLEFVRGWPRESPLVIHCYAGISRSTAAAYATLCTLLPERDEAELAWRLREASPTATPNARLVALADAALRREGRMVRAIEAIGRGADAFEGAPFSLTVS